MANTGCDLTWVQCRSTTAADARPPTPAMATTAQRRMTLLHSRRRSPSRWRRARVPAGRCTRVHDKGLAARGLQLHQGRGRGGPVVARWGRGRGEPMATAALQGRAARGPHAGPKLRRGCGKLHVGQGWDRGKATKEGCVIAHGDG